MPNRVSKTFMILSIALLASVAGFAHADEGKLSPRMAKALVNPDTLVKSEAGTFGVWVRFSDRNLDGAALAEALQAAREDLPERTAARRAKMGGSLVIEEDLPVNGDYLEAVRATGAEMRRTSRWLNSASFDATEAQIAAITALPFVDEVDVVARFRKDRTDLTDSERAALEEDVAAMMAEKNTRWAHDYGGGAPAAELLNIPRAHEMGLTGAGVVIGVMDTGYDLDWHVSMQDMEILATWDFINNMEDVDTIPLRDPEYQSWHGTECLSVQGAYSEGDIIGVAWEASYILAKTERIDEEVRLEEDAWIEALEWMEGLGADIVSSAIGYYEWYTEEDLDGGSAPITLAADFAVSRGVTVVVSGGENNGVVGVPNLNAPADGRKVITVGQADLQGYATDVSSRGPTWDGRIKPDILGCGVGILVSSWWNQEAYTVATGASYANAQVAGVAALILQQNPNLTPLQVREALRMTASRSQWPDNDFGWGVVDAHAAINYWGPAIDHTPVGGMDNYTDPVLIEAEVTSWAGVNDEDVTVTWRVNLGSWNRVGMSRMEGDLFQGYLPPVTKGSFVQYYIEASDASGIILTHPRQAPDNLHLLLPQDDLQPPVLKHHYLQDQMVFQWPPRVRADASDNRGIAAVEMTFQVNGGADQGPFTFEVEDTGYGMDFPLDAGSVVVGDRITYTVTARDISTNALETTLGPFDFMVGDHRGPVLVIDDVNTAKNYEGELPQTAHAGGPQPPRGEKSSPEDITSWLMDMGYEVSGIQSTEVKKGSFSGFDVVILSSGSNYYPLLPEELGNQLLLWARDGGKIMIEGGEVAYAAFNGRATEEFIAEVLHVSEYWGEGGYTFFQTHGNEDHPLSHRPEKLSNTIEMPVPAGSLAYVASDLVAPTDDAISTYSSTFGAFSGGPVAYDNNTGIDGGQIVFYPMSFDWLKPTMGRWLVENAMAYLLVREPLGPSSVSGRVILADSQDHSGVTVAVDSLHTAVTSQDGSYLIEGLWGGDFTVTASLEGYGTRELDFHVDEGQAISVADITLSPTTEIDISMTTPVSIPDNNPTGIASELVVGTTGIVQGITVSADISHYSINNLVVKLVSPTGTEVVLHNRSGGTVNDLVGTWPDFLTVDGPGTMDDFLDEDVQGTWQLVVSDNQFGATGTLNSWGLTIQVSSPEPGTSKGPGPEITRILGNSPNPFNPRTVISFELARAGKVKLDIYDIRGLRVRSLVDGELGVGTHRVLWDGLDEAGRAPASGMYFYKLQSADRTQVEKMLLLR